MTTTQIAWLLLIASVVLMCAAAWILIGFAASLIIAAVWLLFAALFVATGALLDP